MNAPLFLRADTEEIYTRLLPSAENSWNAETRTFTCIFSTGAPVQRYDARGPYTEILSMTGISRADVAPFLDHHRRESLDNVLGAVLSARTVGGKAEAVIELSRHNPSAIRLGEELADGKKFGISAGYSVEEWKETTDPKTGARTKEAVRWTVREISVVAVPADPRAVTRGSTAMPDPTSPASPGNTQPTAVIPPAAPAAPVSGVVMTRAEINVSIRNLARTLNLPAAWADGQIDREATIEQARHAALDEVMRRSTTQPITTATIVHDNTDPTEIRTAMAGALAARMAPDLLKPEGRSVEFMSYRSVDMIGQLIELRGERVNRFDRDAILTRAHTTSDFPLLMQDAANKVLNARYQAADPTYRKWAARRPFNDFKAHKFLTLGDFPSLLEVNESGEVKNGTISEKREQITPKEFARTVVFSRRSLINDDLSALSDLASMAATTSARNENELAYKILTSPPNMADGKALFHADHGNKAAAGTAIDVANVGLAVAALRKQKSIDGSTLNLSPRFLIAGPDKELQARQLLAAIVAAKAADVNPWSGSLELVVDANITGTAWFITADPGLAPVVVYGYVAGAVGPQILTETDFDSQGLKVRAGVDFAVGAIDWVGAYANAGA